MALKLSVHLKIYLYINFIDCPCPHCVSLFTFFHRRLLFVYTQNLSTRGLGSKSSNSWPFSVTLMSLVTVHCHVKDGHVSCYSLCLQLVNALEMSIPTREKKVFSNYLWSVLKHFILSPFFYNGHTVHIQYLRYSLFMYMLHIALIIFLINLILETVNVMFQCKLRLSWMPFLHLNYSGLSLKYIYTLNSI